MTVAHGVSGRTREEVVRRLDELNDTTKAKQAFLNSCSDATWITDEQRCEIRWLLDALIEHRRRVRTMTRIWRSMSPQENVSHSLVGETSSLIDESDYFSPFIDKWRSVVVGRTSCDRQAFWRSMRELAELNLSEATEVEEARADGRS